MTQTQQTGDHHAEHFIVMGVSGAGKSTIAEGLAKRLNLPLIEGDEHHPQANIDKMAEGVPLNDDDRKPWLEELGALMRKTDGPVVLTCSSLKRKYRDLLRQTSQSDILFVYLHGTPELLAERMNSRTGHFMPPSLLESQLASLEAPEEDENSVQVDIGPAPEVIVDRIIASLASRK